MAARVVTELEKRNARHEPSKEDDPAFHKWKRLRRSAPARSSAASSSGANPNSAPARSSAASSFGANPNSRRPGSAKRKSAQFKKFAEAHRQWKAAGGPMDITHVPSAGGLSLQLRRLKRAARAVAADDGQKAGRLVRALRSSCNNAPMHALPLMEDMQDRACSAQDGEPLAAAPVMASTTSKAAPPKPPMHPVARPPTAPRFAGTATEVAKRQRQLQQEDVQEKARPAQPRVAVPAAKPPAGLPPWRTAPNMRAPPPAAPKPTAKPPLTGLLPLSQKARPTVPMHLLPAPVLPAPAVLAPGTVPTQLLPAPVLPAPAVLAPPPEVLSPEEIIQRLVVAASAMSPAPPPWRTASMWAPPPTAPMQLQPAAPAAPEQPQ